MTHLNDEQMTEWLLGSATDEIGVHVNGCPQCRAELEELHGTIGRYAGLMRARAQERTLGAVIPARKPSHKSSHKDDRLWTGRLSWAASAALLVFAVLLLAITPSPRQRVAPAQDADDALLMEIQRDLDREVPQALAPAALLAAERNRVIANQDR